ncbi:hypothetical protein CNMCM7927_008751 [Aspergillus lentulus]|nr:hypothetical protein CNMCM7927_008751 [Aspergillus lentulus]
MTNINDKEEVHHRGAHTAAEQEEHVAYWEDAGAEQQSVAQQGAVQLPEQEGACEGHGGQLHPGACVLSEGVGGT